MISFKQSLLACLSAGLCLAAQAKYDGEDRGRPVQPAQSNATWLQECGACHMAFGPGLLPAESWRKVMAGLDKHFGADASLAPKEAADVTEYLVKYASNRWTANSAPLRITDGQWFKTKHSPSNVAPAVWKRESVKSPANCMACHPGADKGNFDEHGIKIPK